MLANKDNSCGSFVYNLLCTFISQYSNKVDFISMGKAQMEQRGSSPKLVQQVPSLPPLGAATGIHQLGMYMTNIDGLGVRRSGDKRFSAEYRGGSDEI